MIRHNIGHPTVQPLTQSKPRPYVMDLTQNKSQKKLNKAKYGLKLIIPIKIKDLTTIKVGISKSLKWCSKNNDQGYVVLENNVYCNVNFKRWKNNSAFIFQILNQTEAPKSEICLIYKIGQESPKSSHSASQGRKLLGVAVVSRRDSIGKAVRGLMTQATAALTMVAVSKCSQKVMRLFFHCL